MTDETNEYEIPDQIESFVSAVAEIINDNDNEPADGSIFQEQSNHSKHSSGVSNAISQGSLLHINAANHCYALVRSITEPVLAHAPWAICRNILEASAYSSWLLSPDIEAETRSARSYALRFKGSLEQEKFARSAEDFESLELSKNRTSKIESKAVSEGFERIRNKHGKLIGIAVSLPSATDLVESELGMGPEYRLFSAMLHGHHWATQQLSYRKIEATTGIALEEHISPIGLVYLAQKATESFHVCSSARFLVNGWNFDQLNLNHQEVQQDFQRFFESLDRN